MEKSTFFGVSVGPGDPELLTLKALRVLEQCPVIATPRTKGGRTLALDIARQVVDLTGKEILPLSFTMSRDPAQLQAAHAQAAAQVESHLAAGRHVAMLNLGDVSIYASFAYLADILAGKGYPVEMIPGVPSFCAVAARLGESLTRWDQPLHILPATSPGWESALNLPGTKVLMKSGKSIPSLQKALAERAEQPELPSASMVVDCGLPTEQVCRNLIDAPSEPGYFATVLIK